MVDPSPAPSPMPQVGVVLAGRYRLEASLGAGGMAEVFRALDLNSGRRVAVKVLRTQLTARPEAVQRFRREGQVLAALKNPAVVAADAVLEHDGWLFLVMELLEGETLGARIRRGPMGVRELAPIVAGCAAGLSAAHQQGVVHRDLKPDNIFLCRLTGHGMQVKILDFGVSKVRGHEALTQTGQVLGTPRYMCPEQLGAEPDVDPRVDIYALGVILYEALAGGLSPFVAATPTDLIVAILHGKAVPLRSVRADVPAAVEAVVQRAMAKVRAARYASVAELAEAFLEAAAFEPQAEPRPAPDTSALGSMRTLGAGTTGPGPSGAGPSGGALGPAAIPPAPGGKDAAPLREGTFSDVAAFVSAPRDGRGAATASPAPPGRPIPQTAYSELVLAPALSDASVAAASSPATSPPGPKESPSIASPTSGLPSSRPRSSAFRTGALLVAVGLLAGGLAAGTAIAALTWLSQAEGLRGPAPPPPPLDAAPAADAPADPDGGVRSTSEAAPGHRAAPAAGDLSASDPPEPAAAEVEAETAAPGASAPGAPPETAPGAEGPSLAGGGGPTREGGPGAGSPRRGGGDRAAPPEERAEEPARGSPDPAVDPIVAATRALARGDAAECVDILDDVIARGGSATALRRRAECLLRLGEVPEAIRDFRRFCRVAPDHPAIVEVREVLEGLGQSCP
jgi:serine/threonine protein kinase